MLAGKLHYKDRHTVLVVGNDADVADGGDALNATITTRPNIERLSRSAVFTFLVFLALNHNLAEKKRRAMPRILFVSGFHPSTRARDLAYEFER